MKENKQKISQKMSQKEKEAQIKKEIKEEFKKGKTEMGPDAGIPGPDAGAPGAGRPPRPKMDFNTMKRLFSYMKPYKGTLILLCFVFS